MWRRRFGRVDDLDESELAHDVQVVDPAGDPATEAGEVGALERPSNTARVDCFLRSDAVRSRSTRESSPFTARLASDELATLPIARSHGLLAPLINNSRRADEVHLRQRATCRLAEHVSAVRDRRRWRADEGGRPQM